MPRRSQAELSQFPRIDAGRTTHLATPKDLPKSLRDIVTALIQSQKPGHFKQGDEYLLEAYAAAHLLRREAYENIQAEGAVVDGRASPWMAVLEKSSKQLVSLSGRLRLAPQMRATSRDTARRNVSGNGASGDYPTPWGSKSAVDRRDADNEMEAEAG